MKYEQGNFVLLQDGRTVCIFTVDEENQQYQVVDADNEELLFWVTDGEIASAIMT